VPYIKSEEDLFRYAQSVHPPEPAYPTFVPPKSPQEGHCLAINPGDDELKALIFCGGTHKKPHEAFVRVIFAPRSTTRIPLSFIAALRGRGDAPSSGLCPQLTYEMETEQ
jgi:hypothetical protein